MDDTMVNWRVYSTLTQAVQAGLDLIAASPDLPAVLWVDAANRFDPYVILKTTKNPVATKRILKRVYISRPFTIHQLKRLLETDLLEAANRQNTSNALIVGPSAMFLDENVNKDERTQVWKKIVEQIDRLPTQGLQPLVLDCENEYTKIAGEWANG